MCIFLTETKTTSFWAIFFFVKRRITSESNPSLKLNQGNTKPFKLLCFFQLLSNTIIFIYWMYFFPSSGNNPTVNSVTVRQVPLMAMHSLSFTSSRTTLAPILRLHPPWSAIPKSLHGPSLPRFPWTQIGCLDFASFFFFQISTLINLVSMCSLFHQYESLWSIRLRWLTKQFLEEGKIYIQ